jgi:hypothetical protein
MFVHVEVTSESAASGPHLLGTPAAEHREFEYLEVAIHVLESAIAKPLALRLNWRQDVGDLIGPMDEFNRHLLAGLIRAAP